MYTKALLVDFLHYKISFFLVGSANATNLHISQPGYSNLLDCNWQRWKTSDHIVLHMLSFAKTRITPKVGNLNQIFNFPGLLKSYLRSYEPRSRG